ncbi:uncharacterized protein CANTADRAFT_26611 [Suhomyces tanzawaensis NRRL Y-17324]|uniref:Uncharacterized protein n=1 Tax=Suhomyces tanzawaensis NRRL Y-17324 TaxID=984487 RepID=A0A1E4SGM1_9ASCO|nr:uncharacterized protein CANTADRAFT_26611 [Suhomyces tanzawaensis NRRL Y-17324]ODV78562.1 hypothetical protein CANTADRAFT_26611 [Suhomyces tanzawaensis NRRL Y-17324]
MNHNVLKFDAKPREERDFKEIYPDLDEQLQLRVFVRDSQHPVEEVYPVEKSRTPQPLDLKKPTFKRLARHDLKREGTGPKFPKYLTEYGFQEAGSRTKSTTGTTYIRPFQLPEDQRNTGVDCIEKLIERKKNQVEYDMDEQDYLYLKQRNESPQNIIKVTPEIFEIAITTLENEWAKLEHKMNSSAHFGDRYTDNSNKLLTLDLATSNEKYGNDDGIVPGSLYDQKCAVCNDSDCDNSNAIVFCDGCDIAVHQECYGIAFIPEGQWLCRKCMINKNRETNCLFCPSKTGAFKQLDNSLWSHVVCALWINELYFANPIYMEPIEGMDVIPKSRWKLVCYLCKQRMGACIQCSNRNCFQAYHVTCAKRAGLYMEYSQGIQGAITNKLTLKTFCEKHLPPEWDIAEVIRGIQRTRLFFHDIKILNDQNVRLKNSQKTANKLNIFKWKTENNTPIAPKMFSDYLFELMVKLKVEQQVSLPGQETLQLKDLKRLPNRSKEETREEIRNISNELCRYWCLKRESKRGAPLIRKNNNLMNSSSIATSSMLNEGENADEFGTKELEEKVAIAKFLVEDLDKVIGMNSEWIQRQVLGTEGDRMDFEMINTVYFPLTKVIEQFLVSLNQKMDSTKIIRNHQLKAEAAIVSLKQIIDKNSRYEYKSVQQFQNDVQGFYELLVRETKSSHNIARAMKRWMKEFDARLEGLQENELRLQRDLSELAGAANIQVPFVKVHGDQIELQQYDAARVLQENDLSEVEDETSPETEALFQRLLRGR